MGSRTGAWERLGNIAGLTVVVAALALLSPGVRTVRAGDEPRMSIDPGLAAATQTRTSPNAAPAAAAPSSAPPNTTGASPTPPTNPSVPVADVANAQRPGVSGVEIQPGIVVLNTRGYNYGPPPTPLEPAALDQEAAPR